MIYALQNKIFSNIIMPGLRKSLKPILRLIKQNKPNKQNKSRKSHSLSLSPINLSPESGYSVRVRRAKRNVNKIVDKLNIPDADKLLSTANTLAMQASQFRVKPAAKPSSTNSSDALKEKQAEIDLMNEMNTKNPKYIGTVKRRGGKQKNNKTKKLA